MLQALQVANILQIENIVEFIHIILSHTYSYKIFLKYQIQFTQKG